ncbi:MAG: hypothetical protein LIO56_00035 [Lachnospiraceae bacterium]|nr:hypothetical protein [Lachnospiraceae bacterium]
MGIFSKKEICPICGRPIKGDVRIKIKDNVELCQVCSSEIEMDAAMIPNMTVEDIKEHLAYRKENQQAMEQFKATRSADAGSYKLRADDCMRLWYCTNDRSDRNPPLFKYSELKSAGYLEDGMEAEELKSGLKARLSAEKTAPKLVQSMKIVIELDNPEIHRISAEPLKTGEGMTTGTMQYKRNRKDIQDMMECLATIQQNAAYDEMHPNEASTEAQDGETPVEGTSQAQIPGEEQAQIPDMQPEQEEPVAPEMDWGESDAPEPIPEPGSEPPQDIDFQTKKEE